MINVKGLSFTGNGGATGSTSTVTGLGPVGNAPNANAAIISSGNLILEPADGTNPGVLTSGAQTIGGAKTFSGAITASNLSGTNTGDITLTAVDSSPNANAASLSGQVLTLQPANTLFPGVLLAADWNTFNSKQASGNYITALTGNVTASGPGSAVATIPNSTITNAKMANMNDQTIKGNNSGGAAAPLDLTIAQVKTMLNLSGTNSGDVTLSAIGSSPNANAATLSTQALNLEPASASFGGVVTTIAQSFAGLKTFTSNLISSIVSGGSASGATLTLQSTTNATKGIIGFGTSAYDEVNNRLGIGTLAPAWPFDNEKVFTVATNIPQYGMYSLVSFGAADTSSKVGLSSTAVASHTTGAIGGLIAVAASLAEAGNGGTVTLAAAVVSNNTVSTGAVVTEYMGYYVANATGAGGITTQYGLYIEALSKGTVNYAVYTLGIAVSSFGGSIGIRTTDPSNGNTSTSAARYLGITGDGTAVGSANGVLALSNNRATSTNLDSVGAITFASLNNGGGGTNRVVAEIISLLVGVGGTNGFGGYLLFQTKGDNVAGAPTTKALIDSAGNFGIGSAPIYPLDVNGNIAVTAIGSGLRVKEGTNAKMGTAVLVAGAVVVNTTAVTANSRIFLTSNVDGGTPASAVRVSARTAGTSFTITSPNALDTSTVAWIIFEPS